MNFHQPIDQDSTSIDQFVFRPFGFGELSYGYGYKLLTVALTKSVANVEKQWASGKLGCSVLQQTIEILFGSSASAL